MRALAIAGGAAVLAAGPASAAGASANGTYTTIDFPGASGFGTAAYGVSDHGQIVGLYFNGTGERGFEFSPAG